MSTSKVDLKRAVVEALVELGGAGTVPQIARRIWETREADLRAAGDQFFTWQYEMRWAGQQLQKSGTLLKGGKGRQWVLLS